MPAAPELQAVLIPTATTIADAARVIADTR